MAQSKTCELKKCLLSYKNNKLHYRPKKILNFEKRMFLAAKSIHSKKKKKLNQREQKRIYILRKVQKKKLNVFFSDNWSKKCVTKKTIDKPSVKQEAGTAYFH